MIWVKTIKRTIEVMPRQSLRVLEILVMVITVLTISECYYDG